MGGHAALILMFCAAEEEFQALCFDYGIELDDVVSCSFSALCSVWSCMFAGAMPPRLAGMLTSHFVL